MCVCVCVREGGGGLSVLWVDGWIGCLGAGVKVGETVERELGNKNTHTAM